MTGAPERLVIEVLRPDHDVSAFECGVPQLDEFLRRFALSSQRAESARTYVARRGLPVVGFYSLAAGGAEHAEVPERVRKGLARHPVPVVVLARLAVHRMEQGTGIGARLLRHALLQAAQIADMAGVRALLVHAKDDDARSFYERFDFDRSPTQPYRLYLVMKDLRRLIAS